MKLYAIALNLGLFAISTNHAAAQGRAREGWLGDYEVAKEQARKTGKPLFVVFRCEP
jgi:hypothetical protein